MQSFSARARGAVQQRHHRIRRHLRRAGHRAGGASGEGPVAPDARQRRHRGRHGDEDHAAQLQRTARSGDRGAAGRTVPALSGLSAGWTDGCARIQRRQRQDHAAGEDRNRWPRPRYPRNSGHHHHRDTGGVDRKGGREEQDQDFKRQRLHHRQGGDQGGADPRIRSGEDDAGAVHVHRLFGFDFGEHDGDPREPSGADERF